MLDDGEPEARPAQGAAARLVHAVEPLEEARKVPRGDAHAEVDDRKLGPPVPHVAGEFDAVGPRIAQGVLDEVDERLFQQLHVALDGCGVPLHDGQLDALRPGLRRLQLGDALQKLRHVHGRERAVRVLLLPALQLREREHVAGERVQPPRLFADDVEEFRPLRLGERRTVAQHLHRAEEGGERRAQLVRDVGGELAAEGLVGPRRVDLPPEAHEQEGGQGTEDAREDEAGPREEERREEPPDGDGEPHDEPAEAHRAVEEVRARRLRVANDGRGLAPQGLLELHTARVVLLRVVAVVDDGSVQAQHRDARGGRNEEKRRERDGGQQDEGGDGEPIPHGSRPRGSS